MNSRINGLKNKLEIIEWNSKKETELVETEIQVEYEAAFKVNHGLQTELRRLSESQEYDVDAVGVFSYSLFTNGLWEIPEDAVAYLEHYLSESHNVSIDFEKRMIWKYVEEYVLINRDHGIVTRFHEERPEILFRFSRDAEKKLIVASIEDSLDGSKATQVFTLSHGKISQTAPTGAGTKLRKLNS